MPDATFNGMKTKPILAGLKAQNEKGVPRQTATSKVQPLKSSVRV
jgi:hypothetical protein